MLKEFELKCCNMVMGDAVWYSMFYVKCYWILKVDGEE